MIIFWECSAVVILCTSRRRCCSLTGELVYNDRDRKLMVVEDLRHFDSVKFSG